MVNRQTVLTQEGYDRFEAELNYLCNVRRAEVAARLRRVFEEGGELTENAEYEDAKNEQSFVEGRIQELENLLSEAVIITEERSNDVVELGSRVTVQEEGYDPVTYHIVGSAEAAEASSEGFISNVSPLGKALIGQSVGDVVEIQTPDGSLTFTIVAIA